MTILSLDKEKQNPIGIRPYWRKFEKFLGTELHQIFVDEITNVIEKHTSKGAIDSRQHAKIILTKLEQLTPELINEWGEEEVASLFGMTMWNVIARHPDDWYFYRTLNDSEELRGTQYWRA